MRQDLAERSALSVLTWLLAEEELLPVFMGATGASSDDFRSGAADPVFLASVLDFVLMDDAWVLSCAQVLGHPPEHLVEIRAALPGGDLPNWT